MIESTMSKNVSREEGLFSLGAPVEEHDDGPTIWEDEAID